MESMKIKSFYGGYKVHFNNGIDYKTVVKDGDIVVIDRIVYDNYRGEFEDCLNEANTIILDAAEKQKSYEGIIPVIQKIIDRGFHKDNTLIAVGGGITQDVVAFISSILYRGVNWELVPTTLLAQCDSCIGSKTSINFYNYKNQVGGFYPPRNVYISPHYLKSLHDREMKSGLGEMLHYYVAGGEDDFEYFAENCMESLDHDSIMQGLVRRSLEIKKGYVERDEHDKKERQIFNYGHTFGHALESLSGYTIPHGIAVSYGMDIANAVAVEMGLLKQEIRERIRNVTKNFWSEDDVLPFNIGRYMDLLHRDKKNKGNRLGLILCSDFGKLAKYMVDDDEWLRTIINSYFESNGDRIDAGYFRFSF